MASQKIGEMTWDDPSFKGTNRSSGGKDRFLKLKPGSNQIRVLTVPFQYLQHKYKFPEEVKGFGHRIPCSAPNGACAVCAKGDKPKKRWFLGVIDRATNSYKILDVGWSVLRAIQTYAEDSDWGDPTQYDFDIVVNPHAGPQGYYNAVAKPKKPLSAQDLLIKEKEVDLEYLASRCQPPEPSKVEERLQSLMEEFVNGGTSNVDAPVSFGTDEDDDFPNSDGKAIAAPF